MKTFTYLDFAEALELVHGSRAKCEALLQAEICEGVGDYRMAQSWRDIMTYLRTPDCEKPPHLGKIQNYTENRYAA